MTQPTIYTIENIPDDASPEEAMLCRINTIYDNYHNSTNEQLINSRKQMLARLYQIRMNRNGNITDDDKIVQDEEKCQIQLDYENSLNASSCIAAQNDDYKTMYLTIIELKNIYQEFYNDNWLNADSFIETLECLTENFII